MDSFDGRALRLDPDSTPADPNLPAFLSRPDGAPVYYGFPLVEETRSEGWVYGAITDFLDPDGCDAGDGFVEAPDGTRAGLVWTVGDFPTTVALPPSPGRWGVYEIAFTRPIRTVDDLVADFRAVLPELKRLHASAACEQRSS